MATEDKTNYTRRFEGLTRKQFDEAYAFLAHTNPGRIRASDGYHFITFAEYKETEHVRVDPEKRTIELTTKINEDLGELVDHIVSTEIRGDDAE